MIRIRSKIFLLGVAIILFSASNVLDLEQRVQGHPGPIAAVLNKMPLSFIENRGQVDAKVKYLAKTPYGNIFFCPGFILYQCMHEKPRLGEFDTVNIPLRFLGSNDEVRVVGVDESNTKLSYFIGEDSQKWISGVRSFGSLIYRDLYPHVDLIVHGNRSSIKHEYRIKPGGKVEDIQLRYEGVEQLRINERGELEIDGGEAWIKEDAPLSYQMMNGQRIEIKTEYRLEDKNVVGFDVGEYQKDIELIIDPNLIFSTYLGGSGGEHGNDIALDDYGNVYITGWTWSSDFPTTPGAYDKSNNGSRDVFIAKLNPAGKKLLYATYLGGGSRDEAWSIAVDSEGNTYVTGGTWSYNFPTTGDSYDKYYNGSQDVFVVKLDAAGSEIVFSTFLGGGGLEEAGGIAIDDDGRVHIAGWTDSADFPTTSDAYDTSYNGKRDIFLSKLSPGGAVLLFSTYLGGSDDDYLGRIYSANINDTDKVGGIALHGSGRVYITGYTKSEDFPTTSSAYNTSHNGGDHDVFVAKLNPAGTKLLFSTYLGGDGSDQAGGIVVDDEESVYVTGWTGSWDFPTTSAAYAKSRNGGYDAFVTKLSSSGKELFFSTYLGGNRYEHGIGIAVDFDRNVYVTGWTDSSTFPTYPDSYDKSYHGNNDAFLAKLNSKGSGLLYSTYLGGTGADHGYSVVQDGKSNVYIAGWTKSVDFPTTDGAVDTSYSGGHDIFITKLRFPEKPTYILTISAASGGTTDPAPGEYRYHTETEVTIRAIPDTDYRFSRWSGDMSEYNNSNPLALIVDSHKSIKAEFSPPLPPVEWGDGGGGGWDVCFVATAAYDTPLHPHVKILRAFRDKYLLTHKPGRMFVRYYYKHSPALACLIEKHKTLKWAARIILFPCVVCCYFFIHLGPILSVVIFSLMIMISIFLIRRLQRGKRSVS